MKVFVSMDMEGMPGITFWGHVSQRHPSFALWAKVATRIVAQVAAFAMEQGAERVVIADSHSVGDNINILELPESVEVVRGIPRPSYMVYGAEGCDLAFFLGYHARSLKSSVLSHTMSSSQVREIRVDGEPVGELALNAYLLGEMGIPVGLVAGTEELREEVERFVPWATFVPMKRSITRFSALCPHPAAVEVKLKEGVSEALGKLKKGELKPLKPPKPAKIEMEFVDPTAADLASFAPGVEKTGDCKIAFEAESFSKAYDGIFLLTAAAYSLREFLK